MPKDSNRRKAKIVELEMQSSQREFSVLSG